MNQRVASAPLPTERQVQRAILAMCGRCFPDMLIHHSPSGAQLAGNATARFKQMGALKGDGLKTGFPDLILAWGGGKCGFFEVKRLKLGKVSADQKAMIDRLAGMGHRIAVVRSVEEAFDHLKLWGAPWNGVEP